MVVVGDGGEVLLLLATGAVPVAVDEVEEEAAAAVASFVTVKALGRSRLPSDGLTASLPLLLDSDAMSAAVQRRGRSLSALWSTRACQRMAVQHTRLCEVTKTWPLGRTWSWLQFL